MNRKATIVSITCLSVFFLLSLNQCTQIIPDKDYNENKKKIEKPKFDLNNLDEYPKRFEAYLSENFSLRGYFLDFMGRFNYYILKKPAKVDRLIVGKNDWLYSIDKELSQYQGTRNLSDQDLEVILHKFSERERVLDSMGIDMYIVINPTKYSVYPEFLPSNIQCENIEKSTQRFIDYFKKNSSIRVISTVNEVIKNKNKHQLYYKGDNHWNEIGGYYASKAIIERMRNDYPNLPFYKIDDYNIDTVKYVGNLANMTGFGEDFHENEYKFSLKKNEAEGYKGIKYPVIKGFPYPWAYQKHYITNQNNLPNIFIIRDSFGTALIPFLKNSFNKSLFIFDSWRYAPNFDIVEQEKPDIVVYMMLESLITVEKFQKTY